MHAPSYADFSIISIRYLNNEIFHHLQNASQNQENGINTLRPKRKRKTIRRLIQSASQDPNMIQHPEQTTMWRVRLRITFEFWTVINPYNTFRLLQRTVGLLADIRKSVKQSRSIA